MKHCVLNMLGYMTLAENSSHLHWSPIEKGKKHLPQHRHVIGMFQRVW